MHFLYFFALIAWPSPSPLPAQNAEANQLFQSGQQKYRTGDLDGAVKTFRKAVVLQPGDPNIQFALAQALGDQGASADAVAVYQKTLQLYEQAQSRAALTVTYKPSIAMVWNNLAVLYCRDKRFDDARSAIDRAFSLWSNPNAAPARFFVTRGMTLEGLKQPDRAVQAYQTALQKDPRNADALLDLGSLFLARSQTDDGLLLLQRGVAAAPDDPDMLTTLGSALAKKDRWNDAADSYRQSLALRPDHPETTFNLATALAHQGKPSESESLEVLERAHQIAPGDPAISASLAAALAKSGNKKEAKALLAAHPDNPELLNTSGLLQMADMRLPQAEASFARAIAQKPELTDARVNHAVAMLLQHRRLQAIAEFREVLKADPRNLKAHSNLAAALFEAGQYPQAAEEYSRAVDLSPDDPDLRENLATAL